VAVGLIAASWAFLLRRQVRRQLTVIQRKLQNEAAVEERRRIAREFYDSLEQELAALALRLDAAASCMADPEVRRLLEQERSLAARLQTETRQFVWDLRDPARSHWTLEALLAGQIEVQQAESSLPIRLAMAGRPIRLPPLARYQLLRIIREAVHNAIEHSGGTAVDVGPADEAGRVVALIADDGTGFNLAAREKAVGHFGIRGMPPASDLAVGQRWRLTLTAWDAAVGKDKQLETLRRVDDTEFDADRPVYWVEKAEPIK
jgi:signal transduction histidine kinase